MAKKRYKVDILSLSSIQKLKNELEAYKDELPEKCRKLVDKLAQEGIIVAKQNLGNFGKYITFSIQTNMKTDGCEAVLLATNTGIIHSEWQTKEGIKSADVSPLLMVEFGSGLKAENPNNISGVGTGTFPGQTHAADPSGWWWKDLEGKWHHSQGMAPKAPMYKASVEMFKIVAKTAKEVFT